MGLELWLLGSPRIEVENRPLQVDTRKATALLIYLAERGEPQRRESLAAMFWPESDGPHAKAALRRTLSALRKAVGEEWVSADRQRVTLTPPWLDTREFRSLIASTHEHEPVACVECRQLLKEAVGLYRDPFLAGFTLPDSPAFDEWQYFAAHSLLSMYSEALQRLVLGHEMSGELEQSVEFANHRLAVDPLNESAHRDLMALHARLGQRGQAIQQYRECVRILQEELGAPPLEATAELYEQIKAGDLELNVARPEIELVEIEPLAAEPFPLVGRDRQLGQLRAAYASADRTQLVVIEGEAGVGKTRLAEEFLNLSGAAYLQARCYQDESSIAYRPWIDAFRIALSNPTAQDRLKVVPEIWLTEAARLLPEINDLLPEVPKPSAEIDLAGQDRFMNGLAQVAGALAAGGIVFIDDLHWSDEASLKFLSYLVRRGPALPLYLVTAWLVESTADDQRLRAWIATLPAVATSIVSLPLLTEPEVQELVIALNSSTPAKKLFQETEGLPLFLAEYISAGTFESGTDDRILPGPIEDILKAKLASISGASQQLLGTAAVIGRSFEFETLRIVSGRTLEETVSGLEELMAAGFVREFPQQERRLGPTYDFRHQQLREQSLSETTRARQRLLHARAAEALRRIEGAAASRIGRHFELAGNDEKAAVHYLEAGDHARQLYANEEAISHYRSALALGNPDPSPVHEALADLLTMVGKYDVAAQEYETAAAYQDEGRTAEIEYKQGKLFERWGKRDRAVLHYETAVSGFPEASEQARVYADWSLTVHRQGQSKQARELIERALQAALEAEDDRALARCYNILGILERSEGNGTAALEHLSMSLNYSEAAADFGARAAARNNLALAYADQGDFQQAIQHEQQALELSESLGDRHRAAAIHSNLADLMHQLGDDKAAETHLTQSAALFAEVGIVSGDYEPEIWKLVEW